MVMVILASEIGVALAMDQYLSARLAEGAEKMKEGNYNAAGKC